MIKKILNRLLYFDFLKKNPYFFRFLIADSASWTGGIFTQIARVVLFYNLTKSALLVAELQIFGLIPIVILSPLSGILSDWGKKKSILVVTELVNGILVLTYPWITSPGIFYILIFFQGCLSSLFSPARFSVIPEVVKKEDLIKANTIDNATQNFFGIIAPIFAGICIKLGGVNLAFIINAITYFLSSFLLSTLSIQSKKEFLSPSFSLFLSDLFSGVKFIKENISVKTILVVSTLIMLCGGAINSLLLIFIKEFQMGSEFSYSLLLSLGSLGSLLGSQVLFYLNLKICPENLFLFGTIGAGTSLLLFSLTKNLELSLIFFFINGFIGNALLQVGFTTTLMEESNKEFIGKIFSIYFILLNLASLTSVYIARILLPMVNIRKIYSLGAIIILLIGIISLIYRNAKLKRS